MTPPDHPSTPEATTPTTDLATSRGREAFRYDLETIQRGLHETVVCAGNVTEAARRLKAAGTPVPRSTLESWVNRVHREQYQRIWQEQERSIVNVIAQQCEELAIAAHNVEMQGLRRLAKELPGMDKRDLAGAVRNVSTSKGIALQNANNLRGRPTSTVEHRTIQDLERALVNLGVAVVGDDPEITDAEVVSP